MKITEKKEVTHVTVDEVIVGRKCDICGKQIERIKYYGYNYFLIHTWHNDWGNDSIESHEYMDACCPECVMKFAESYLSDAYKKPVNTHAIEIEHIRTLEDGADHY